MKDELLRLDVELLLCRYGRQRVLSALAEVERYSLDDLEQKLLALQERKQGRNAAKSRKTIVDMLEIELNAQPERVAILRPFVAAYESGTLLPSLKSVQRFLESRGEKALNVKSRKLAGPAFLKALSAMNESELDVLRRNAVDDGQSDYSLLSEAILRGGVR